MNWRRARGVGRVAFSTKWMSEAVSTAAINMRSPWMRSASLEQAWGGGEGGESIVGRRREGGI